MFQGAVTILHVESYSGDQSNIKDAGYQHHCAHLHRRDDIATALQHAMFVPPFRKRQKRLSIKFFQNHAVYKPERVPYRPTLYPISGG